MVAVSDTSAISNLALIGRLDLLRSQFQVVWIPEAVQTELEQVPAAEAHSLIEQAYQAGWLRRRAVNNLRVAEALASDLDKGEAEAITLAIEIKDAVLLIDDQQGRNFARQAGIPVRGVLGVLIKAKTMGELASVKNEIEALRTRASFFVAPPLEADVPRAVGE